MSLRIAEDSVHEQGGPDDIAWADRSEYWIEKYGRKSRRFQRWGGVRPVLILSGHGVRLHIDHGTLVVRDGFTHYPQTRTTWRFFPGEWRVPSRIIILDANGSLSLDALAWLSRQNISLVQINWRGEVTTVIGGAGSVDLALARRQAEARSNGKGIRLARWFIQTKIANSVEILRCLVPKSEAAKQAIARANDALHELARRPPARISRILTIEGNFGWAYFNAWRSLPLRWKGTSKIPLPDDWARLGKRTSGLNPDASNRNATHPFNAMLNYGYGVLENQVRSHVVARGLDPATGFLHTKRRGERGLVLDLMEPLRPLVDKKVFRFMSEHTFAKGDFNLLSNGVCRLNPHLARSVVRAIDVSADVQQYVSRFVRSLN